MRIDIVLTVKLFPEKKSNAVVNKDTFNKVTDQLTGKVLISGDDASRQIAIVDNILKR